MTKMNPELQKLLEVASSSKTEPEVSLSQALENKIIVDWRNRVRGEAEIWASSLFTPALILASILMMISISLYEWRQSSFSTFPFADASIERYLPL